MCCSSSHGNKSRLIGDAASVVIILVGLIVVVGVITVIVIVVLVKVIEDAVEIGVVAAVLLTEKSLYNLACVISLNKKKKGLFHLSVTSIL